MINEKTLTPFLHLLSNEQIGKVIREFIKPSEVSLNEIEAVLLSSLNEKKGNYKQAALKRWQTRKQKQTQKEDLTKKENTQREITQRTYSRPFYNNYKRRDEQPIKQNEIKYTMIDPLDDNLI